MSAQTKTEGQEKKGIFLNNIFSEISPIYFIILVVGATTFYVQVTSLIEKFAKMDAETAEMRTTIALVSTQTQLTRHAIDSGFKDVEKELERISERSEEKYSDISTEMRRDSVEIKSRLRVLENSVSVLAEQVKRNQDENK